MVQVCPVCHHKSNSPAERCTSCGALLPSGLEAGASPAAWLRPLLPPIAIAAGGLLAYLTDSSLYLGAGALMALVFSLLIGRRPH